MSTVNELLEEVVEQLRVANLIALRQLSTDNCHIDGFAGLFEIQTYEMIASDGSTVTDEYIGLHEDVRKALRI